MENEVGELKAEDKIRCQLCEKKSEISSVLTLKDFITDF